MDYFIYFLNLAARLRGTFVGTDGDYLGPPSPPPPPLPPFSRRCYFLLNLGIVCPVNGFGRVPFLCRGSADASRTLIHPFHPPLLYDTPFDPSEDRVPGNFADPYTFLPPRKGSFDSVVYTPEAPSDNGGHT